MSISDVQHQPRAHRVIQRALTSERVPHAYVFAGPEGVGKEMMAMGLAQLLLCESPVQKGDERDACGQCQECRLVMAGTHPDLFIIHRQLNKQHPDSTIRKQKALTLSVEVVRFFLIEKVGTYPARGRAKVFIVREAERMNDAAQNSLLKTLEEPPEDTFLILLTSALDRLLPTTRSRCQKVLFQPLPTDYVAERIKTLRPDTNVQEVTFASQHAVGSIGSALRQIDDGLFAIKKTWGDRLVELVTAARGFAPHALADPFENDAKTLGKGVSERDSDVSDTDATRAGLQTLLGVLAAFYTDALRKGTGAKLPLINADQANVIDRLVSARNVPSLTASLRHISQADANLGRNANIELTLETMFIQLAATARSAIAV